MSILKEFKAFAMKGNVIDLAVGVVIGAAFGKIVAALVDNIIMPFVGILLQGHNVAAASFKVGSAVLEYGAFFQAVIDFLIIAFVLFMVIRLVNSVKKKEAEQPAQSPSISKEEELLTEIRDLLKK